MTAGSFDPAPKRKGNTPHISSSSQTDRLPSAALEAAGNEPFIAGSLLLSVFGRQEKYLIVLTLSTRELTDVDGEVNFKAVTSHPA
ncbi:MAG: hypothetical protein DI528_11860 [Shinella sp.]|nr:MAG: hypothetical protein DI528_11860 [Shinella sp.]